MSGYLFALSMCAVVVGLLFFLLRTRRIKEKYAGIWIALAVAVVVLGVFPELAYTLADAVGVRTPVNLLFALAFVVLLSVCIQLSSEITHLEENTRTLAEEIALLRLDLVQRIAETGPANPPGGTGNATPEIDGPAPTAPADGR